MTSAQFKLRAREALENEFLQQALARAKGGFVDKRKAAVDQYPDFRDYQFEAKLTPPTTRYGLQFWAFFAKRPALYRFATSAAMGLMHWLGGRRARLSRAPLAQGWTGCRDLPAPQRATFQTAWRRRRKKR